MTDAPTYTLMAWTEYSKLLCYALYPQLYLGIRQIWDKAKQEARAGQVVDTFQRHLKLVPRWNQDLIDKVYRAVLEKLPLRLSGATSATSGKMLDDLITRVFVLTTEIMASPFKGEKILVTVPPASRFIHNCYKECARQFYAKHYLLEDRPDKSSRYDQAKNLDKANQLIISCIEDTIRNLLPIESLLSQRVPNRDADGDLPGRSQSRGRSHSRGRSGERARTPNLFLSDDEDDKIQTGTPAGTSRAASPQTREAAEGRPDVKEHEPPYIPDELAARVSDSSEPEEETLTVRFDAKKTFPSDEEVAEEGRGRAARTVTPRARKGKRAPSNIDPDDLPPIFENEPEGKAEEAVTVPDEDPAEVKPLPPLDQEIEGMDYFEDT
jgi:uncharacterized protein DUF5764